MNFPNASKTFKKLNPSFFAVGQFQPAIAQQKDKSPLDRKPPGRKKGKVGVVGSSPFTRITLINLRHKPLDDDNLIGGQKHLRDAIAAWLEIDDGDPNVEWEYAQALTRGKEGTAVRIEII